VPKSRMRSAPTTEIGRTAPMTLNAELIFPEAAGIGAVASTRAWPNAPPHRSQAEGCTSLVDRQRNHDEGRKACRPFEDGRDLWKRCASGTSMTTDGVPLAIIQRSPCAGLHSHKPTLAALRRRAARVGDLVPRTAHSVGSPGATSTRRIECGATEHSSGISRLEWLGY